MRHQVLVDKFVHVLNVVLVLGNFAVFLEERQENPPLLIQNRQLRSGEFDFALMHALRSLLQNHFFLEVLMDGLLSRRNSGEIAASGMLVGFQVSVLE